MMKGLTVQDDQFVISNAIIFQAVTFFLIN